MAFCIRSVHLVSVGVSMKSIALVSSIALLLSSNLSAFASAEQASQAPRVSNANKIQNLKEEANQAFWNQDYKIARSNLQKLLLEAKEDSVLRARILVNLAICDAQEDDLSLAMKRVDQALKLVPAGSLMYADALLVRARGFYILGKVEDSRNVYLKATDLAEKQLGPWNSDLATFYEGLAACAVSKGDWKEAECYYKKVAQLDFLKYGSDSVQLGWALLSLRNAESKLHKDDLEAEIYKKVFWNFRRQNEKRILANYKELPDQDRLAEELHKLLYGSNDGFANENKAMAFVKEGIPAEILEGKAQSREHNFDNWYRHRSGRDRAPGLAFFDPTKNLKGIIIAVHGLGLYHGAFTPFAEKIQHEGYGVVAFDVRGFGTYRNDEVYQRLNLQGAVDDLTRILTELRSDYPKTPFILLGESMGGAIVLRLAATQAHLVDAVISSVPSGSRFKGRSTAIGVGIKLIAEKHKQFNMGKQVVERATQKPDLRDMWEGDPNVRMNFSASELLNFQRFMSDNLQYAQQIVKTPVIMFQGYSDNLVKPMGTLAIYQAIKNKDKDLLFIGRAEHLIFEEGQFDADIYKGVLAWINKHVAAWKPLDDTAGGAANESLKVKK